MVTNARRLAATTAPDFESYSFDPFACVRNAVSVEAIRKLQSFARAVRPVTGRFPVKIFGGLCRELVNVGAVLEALQQTLGERGRLIAEDSS
jgi:hypothetical protein